MGENKMKFADIKRASEEAAKQALQISDSTTTRQLLEEVYLMGFEDAARLIEDDFDISAILVEDESSNSNQVKGE